MATSIASKILAESRGVAFLGWGGGERELDAGACGVEQVGGVCNVDAEPTGFGDAGHEGP